MGNQNKINKKNIKCSKFVHTTRQKQQLKYNKIKQLNKWNKPNKMWIKRKNKQTNKVLKWLEIKERVRMRVRESEGDIALPRYNFQRLIGVTWSRCRHCYCCYYCCLGQSPCHHLLNVSPFDCWYWLGQTIRFRPLLDKLYPLLVQLYQLYANFYVWFVFRLLIHAIIIFV